MNLTFMYEEVIFLKHPKMPAQKLFHTFSYYKSCRLIITVDSNNRIVALSKGVVYVNYGYLLVSPDLAERK